jgi:hypothetical protein
VEGSSSQKRVSEIHRRRDGAVTFGGDIDNMLIWLVVWDMIYFSMGIIIPTDELIFFRGVGIPPTSNMKQWSRGNFSRELVSRVDIAVVEIPDDCPSASCWSDLLQPWKLHLFNGGSESRN